MTNQKSEKCSLVGVNFSPIFNFRGYVAFSGKHTFWY